jgi:coproporphyrinogen III oxidase-like Fe-S oxidoreductase
LGPSSHGFDGAERRWNEAAYVEWQRRIAGGSDPLAGRELLTAEDAADERAYLGLRTSGGLTLANGEVARVSAWIDQGWAALHDGNRLVLTPQGWLRLDALTADLTVERSRYYV